MAGLGSKTVKNSGLARLGSDRVGLAKERVGNSGDSAGGLGRYQIAGCDVQLLWHFVCICGAMVLCVHGSVCGYKHDWAPAASNKDTVAMGFVRGTAMVDFHIHGRLEKNGLGWAWQYQCQTMKRLKTAAWLAWGRIGLATERVGNSGDSAGGLGR